MSVTASKHIGVHWLVYLTWSNIIRFRAYHRKTLGIEGQTACPAPERTGARTGDRRSRAAARQCCNCISLNDVKIFVVLPPEGLLEDRRPIGRLNTPKGA